jgi:site-specific DNA-methyltransferase (adenine-specific)
MSAPETTDCNQDAARAHPGSLHRLVSPLRPYYEDAFATIYHGEALDVLSQMHKGAANVFITDPPYSSGGLHRSDRARPASEKYVVTGTYLDRPEFAGDNRDQRSFLLWCSLWLSQCLRIGGANSSVMAFCDWRQLPIFSDAIQAGGWTWKGLGVWDKTEATRPNKGWIRSQCEYVVMGHAGALQLDGDCHPGVWRYAVRQDDKHHIAGKPVPLMRDIVNIRPGVILDPFMGSGSTLVAARELGRHSIGIKVCEEYCEVAARRLSQGVFAYAPARNQPPAETLEMQMGEERANDPHQRREPWRASAGCAG